jgi:CheY-like chemotaxis protein
MTHLLLVDREERDGDAFVARLRAAVGADVVIVRAVGMTDAFRRLESLPAIDVLLLDPEAPDMTPLEAFRALRERAPDVPVLVLPGIETDHLAFAIRTVTRSPQGAAAAARRLAALLPRYLLRREEDGVALREAMEREDYECIARIGHNLRGNGVSFGLPELSAIGERIEAAARDRSRSRLEEPIALLHVRLDRILRQG